MGAKKRGFFVKSFTLAELMLAVAFLVTTFAALIASFIACFLLNEANRNAIIAVSHAQYIMEEIKNKASTTAGFDQLTSSYVDGKWDWNSVANFSDKNLIRLSEEEIDTTVSGTNPLTVVVKVKWKDRNRLRDPATGGGVVLETIITKP